MNKDFRSMLDELKNDYLKDFPEKVENIKSFFDEKDIENLKSEFHKIKGTGKTYGFPEISELGALGEELCQKNNFSSISEVIVMLDLFVKNNGEFNNENRTTLNKLLKNMELSA